ncbi:hypothetical protein ACWIUD_06080 [Helicobacter sp. 23-1044]
MRIDSVKNLWQILRFSCEILRKFCGRFCEILAKTQNLNAESIKNLIKIETAESA